MRIYVARGAGEIDRLQSVWDFLYDSNPQATLFQTFAWNRLAALHFADRESPYVVLAESDSSVALIPAAVTRHGLALVGETLFDYREELCAGSQDALHAALARLAELHLPLSITALRGETARKNWEILEPEPFVVAPQVLRRELDSDAFTTAHRRAGRTLRRLAKEGAELHQYDGRAKDLVSWIYRKKAAQFDGAINNLFSDPARVQYMKLACGLNSRMCDIYTLEAGGQPIAALLTFRDHTARRFYTVWFDDAWAQFSPGIALLYEVTRLSLEAGLDCDYMTGEQSHKLRFATSSVPLFRVQASAETLAQAVPSRIPSAA